MSIVKLISVLFPDLSVTISIYFPLSVNSFPDENSYSDSVPSSATNLQIAFSKSSALIVTVTLSAYTFPSSIPVISGATVSAGSSLPF